MRFDDPFDPLQVLGWIATVASGCPAQGRLRRSLFVLLDLGQRGLEILEGKLPLAVVLGPMAENGSLLAQLLRPFAMHRLVQLGDKVFKTLDQIPQLSRFTFECQVIPQQRGDSLALIFEDAERSIGRALDMVGSYHDPVCDGQLFRPPDHSATTGRRAF
ncbi:hypothetical protein [Pseudooceanicola spongiae]|uniref:hypothetical protein n=1 Tax=Pseudooceanicola spongiae TaxID=2613965 RepID=UPI0018677720|nr:hypothetical protein [Pseudooceanicola spongiae]